MKLKYYLRGIGIGVVVTTLIFMVSITLHKNEDNPKTPAEDQKSATVADMMETETESETENESTQEEKQSDAKVPEQKSTEVKKPETKGSETKVPEEKSSEAKPADKKEENTVPNDKTSADASDSNGKVRFEIGGGEYSDVICKKLQQANLVDSAEEFNKFLITNNYDNLILPGVYAIPKGSSYEEIAKLLTTKIEEE